ncbi:MAG: uroporphyrinogen decarboxylase family protein [Saccharofermentanales bacterium]
MDYRTPNKQRMLDVLNHRKPDRVPNFEVLVDNPAFNTIMGRTVTGLDGSHTLANIDPQDYIEFVKKIGQDVIGMCFYSLPFYYKDDSGNRRHVDYVIKSKEDLDRILPMSIEDLAPRFRLLEEYRKAVAGTDIGTFAITGSILGSLYDMYFKFDNFMYTLYDDFELIERALEMCISFHEMIISELLKYDLTFLYIGDDIAFKSTTLINPEILRKIWIPGIERMIRPFKKKNIPVLFHSDGNMIDVIPDLIDIGVDAINPIEPYGMDIRDIKRRFGKNLTLFGNLDVGGNLSLGTPASVRKEAEELIDAVGTDGGFVLCSSHSITKNVPADNFLAMVETAQTYGVY